MTEAEEGQEVDETAPEDFLSKFLDAHDKDLIKFTEFDIKVEELNSMEKNMVQVQVQR
ncbi:hypothetical protein B0A55_13605 [Friedmanniomyces simplex]|uniref:Uncharacterized protein n=1 Tax=Friedmanniomyces simplex TaxID=329884 RepID=A0A4U0W810_9PEZI|nr:hypothetical protein B0A55_13605 [Friedmanniomyces simplex]